MPDGAASLHAFERRLQIKCIIIITIIIIPDVFTSALQFGTFSAIMVTYTASALLHVSLALYCTASSTTQPHSHNPHSSPWCLCLCLRVSG